MVTITPAAEQPVTRIHCPKCKTAIPRVGLSLGSTVSGLLFKCKCGYNGAVTTK